MVANRQLAVRCADVDKFYGKGGARTQALHGCSLEACMGEILMLVGPSGCGKTTLLSVIVGILDTDAGDIEVFGEHVHAMNAAQKARFRRKNVGFAFQQFNLLPTLSAVENAALPLLIAGEPRRKAMQRAGDMLSTMGMPEKLDKLPRELSGGQQQRVAFSRALVHEPRLVVCDEPTSALDGKTGEAVMQQLRKVALRADRAVIVVTHDPRIYHHADRIAQMEDGHIVQVTMPGDANHPQGIRH
ncbi:MAG TPA: ABC transporter ATP-binding protein [Phycisphaerae bacterium]|nr:ABC transporter ATP-binding protein [Phycisphaerae bacterium]